ncbi:hypothetical protein ACFW9F_08090, partial [Streptomyces sp. NPDC059506]
PGVAPARDPAALDPRGRGGTPPAARPGPAPPTRNLPIALDSASSHSEAELGGEAGVDVFLPKPFEPGELVRTVRRLVRDGRAARGTTITG